MISGAKMKKILFITNKAPHYRLPLFNSLAKKVDITFFLTNEKNQIKKLKAKQIISKGEGIGKLKIHRGLIKEIKNNNYELVFMLPPDAAHLIVNYLIYYACKKKKIPFVFWTERWEYFKTPLKDKVSNFFHKFLLRRANKILVSGIKSKEWVMSKGVNRRNVIITPNASEITYKKSNLVKLKNKIRKKYKLKNKKVVLYLGRLIKRKGLSYLIEAFSEIKDKNSILIIAGGGDFYKLGERSLESKLKRQVGAGGIKNRIIFTGCIEHSETAAYYSLADLFVYPSITKGISEPWGLTLNEAMQFGLPIISTTAVGAAYDLIEEGKNGFIVNEKNSKELTIAIEKILNNDELRKGMGKVSMQIINKRNNYDKMVGGFIRAIK